MGATCSRPAAIITSMTQLDVLYRYGAPPAEAAITAIARLREVYGIRRVELREAEKTVRVEFDASRLTQPVIHQLLRRAGLDIVEELPLVTLPVANPAPIPTPDPTPAPAQPAK